MCNSSQVQGDICRLVLHTHLMHMHLLIVYSKTVFRWIVCGIVIHCLTFALCGIVSYKKEMVSQYVKLISLTP